MIARNTDDKKADKDYHAVPPPDCKAGGDFKREELCQQDPQTFTITATGASSSSGRLEAVKDPLNTGQVKVYPQTNTDRKQLIQQEIR